MREASRAAGPRAALRPLLLGVALIGVTLALPRAAGAQQRDTTAVRRPLPTDPRLTPGHRIRVTLNAPEGLRLAGRIDSVVARGFVLDTAEQRSILFIAPGPELLAPYRVARVRYEDIARLEASRGTSRKRGALIGGLIGAAIGGVVTGLSSSPQRNPGGGDVLSAAAGGVIVGGLLGSFSGYALGRERWAEVAWP